MNSLRSMIAVAALAFTMPAQAAVGDPEVIIYRVSGVVDDAGGNARATSFHCTNFSGVTETIRFVVRDAAANVVANAALAIGHLRTISMATKGTAVYFEDVLTTGIVIQGTAAIAATSVNVTCTAMQVAAASLSPQGIALHMTRFNPVPGTQE